MSAHAHAAMRNDAHGYMRITIGCPHCKAKGTAVHSEEIRATLREITYRCSNWRCGHVYAAGLEIVRTLSASAMPAPDVRLPMSRHVRREQMAFQLGTDPEADYAAELYRPMSDWDTLTAQCRAAAHAPGDRYMRIKTACPHCRARAVAVDSREMSRTMREITYRCSNHRCGHVYVASLEVLRTVSLSAMPAADVDLPLCGHMRRDQLALQLARADGGYQASMRQPAAGWAAPPIARAAPA